MISTTTVTHYRLVMIVEGVPIRGGTHPESPIKKLTLGATGKIEELEIEDNVTIQYMDLTKLSFLGVEEVQVSVAMGPA